MAKIKVHELAKELGADKGEIVAYLRAKGYAAMTGVTAVPEGEVENVRSRFGGKSRTAAREKTDAKAGRPEGQEAPKKSKGIVRVFRSHNASAPAQKKARGTDLIDPENKIPAAAPAAAEKNEVPPAAPKAVSQTPSAPAKDVTSVPGGSDRRPEPVQVSRDAGSQETAKTDGNAESRERAAIGNTETRERAAAGSAETREKAAPGSTENAEKTAAGNVETREKAAAGNAETREKAAAGNKAAEKETPAAEKKEAAEKASSEEKTPEKKTAAEKTAAEKTAAAEKLDNKYYRQLKETDSL